jgi:hypothetical protein
MKVYDMCGHVTSICGAEKVTKIWIANADGKRLSDGLGRGGIILTFAIRL